mmetsp:Transcript_156512/g.502244  ORF Transcript_156512/g.502244 Transcript_156512/m.502244 type:complete len:377 (+) Transcript_156512:355-1485(+)
MWCCGLAVCDAPMSHRTTDELVGSNSEDLAVRKRLVQVGHDLHARIQLRLPLASGPGAREGAACKRHVHRGAEEGRPTPVPGLAVVGPIPHAGAGLQLPGIDLLQAVLHTHNQGLALRCQLPLLAPRAQSVALPAGRSIGQALGGDPDEGRVRLEEVLVARTLQVPQSAARRISICLQLTVAVLSREGVWHSEDQNFSEGLELIAITPVGPSRRPGHRRPHAPRAELSQNHRLWPKARVVPFGFLWLLVFLDPVFGRILRIDLACAGAPEEGSRIAEVLHRDLAPAVHEERERPLCRVPLRHLLRESPRADDMVRNAIEQERDRGAELEASGIRALHPSHPGIIAPPQNRAIRRQGKELRSLDELLQLRDGALRGA